MNPNIPEEAGQTARSVVEALKVQPAVLAIVILNVIFIGTVGWLTYVGVARRDALLMAKEEEVVSLTNKCIDIAIKVMPH